MLECDSNKTVVELVSGVLLSNVFDKFGGISIDRQSEGMSMCFIAHKLDFMYVYAVLIAETMRSLDCFRGYAIIGATIFSIKMRMCWRWKIGRYSTHNIRSNKNID